MENDFEQVRTSLRERRAFVMEGLTYVVFDVGEQRVRVVDRKALGQRWLVVASVICLQELVEHDGALRYNRDHEGVGAIALERGFVQLRVVLPGATDLGLLDVVIDHVAEEASRLRHKACARYEFVPELFVNYQE